MDIKRYDIGTSFFGGPFPLAQEGEEGEWVRFDDAVCEIQEWERVAADLAASLTSHMGRNCGGCSAVRALAAYDAQNERD